MNGNSLSNKDVSNRVSQADEEVGIVVYTSSIHHLCCALLPGSTGSLGDSGVIDLCLPVSAAQRSAVQALKYFGSMSEHSEWGGRRLFSQLIHHQLIQCFSLP